VDKLSKEDIGLLFKELVIIDEEESGTKNPKTLTNGDDLPTKETPTEVETAVEAPILDQTGGKKEVARPQESEVENPVDSPSAIDETIAVEESKPIVEVGLQQPVKTHPFICLVHEKDKEALLKAGSSFLKILQALKIEAVSKYVTTIELYKVEQTEIQYSVVWVITDEAEEVKSEINLPKTYLVSKNPIHLTTKEDKLEMYNPLKEFINSNMDTFSQI
jgi:hypothetical protein